MDNDRIDEQKRINDLKIVLTDVRKKNKKLKIESKKDKAEIVELKKAASSFVIINRMVNAIINLNIYREQCPDFLIMKNCHIVAARKTLGACNECWLNFFKTRCEYKIGN